MRFDKYTKLFELIEFCSEPKSIEERAARVVAVSEKYPTFKAFLLEPYDETISYDEVLAFQEMVIKTQRPMDEYGYSVTATKFLSEMPYYRDGSVMKVSIRFNKILSGFDYMDRRDALIVIDMMHKENLQDLNSIVLRAAFPEFFEGK